MREIFGRRKHATLSPPMPRTADGRGESSAFVNVVWRSTRDDGVMYTEWPTAYHLVKAGEVWKILVIVLRYEAPREAPCS